MHLLMDRSFCTSYPGGSPKELNTIFHGLGSETQECGRIHRPRHTPQVRPSYIVLAHSVSGVVGGN